jgi:Zn-dependent protease with chaperone function
MNFFKEQQIARERLSKFRRLFFLTVLITAYGTAFVFDTYLTIKENSESFSLVSHLYGPFFWIVLCAVLFFIFGMSFFKRLQMRAGGEYVAKKAGGKEIPIGSKDIKHIRLKNVVEEMSIASGIIPPKIFILEDELDINAFAAGFTINDAVIGVSIGCLQKLTRDELQGVIAHEIGHIVNGDMRLNLELIGYLFGLSGIADVGRVILRGSSNSRDRGRGGHMGGAFIYLIGIVGFFLGHILKQAISRGQEFAADAKAVQLTRNPDGIGGALKKIFVKENSFAINSNHAEEISHLWFHWPKSNLFSSHPPLQERIVKILPRFDLSNFVLKEKKDLRLKVEGDLSDEITKSFAANNTETKEVYEEVNVMREGLELQANKFFEAIASHTTTTTEMNGTFVKEMDLLLSDLRFLDQETILKLLNRFKEIIAKDKNIIPREILCFILFKETLLIRKKIPSTGLGLTKARSDIFIVFSFLAQISSLNKGEQLEYFKKSVHLVFGESHAEMPSKFKTNDLIKSLEVCQGLVPLAKEKLLMASISIIDQQKDSSFDKEVFKKVLAQMLGVPANFMQFS